MKEVHYLETLDDIKTFMEPIRIKIFEVIGERKMTAKQIADEIVLSPTKVHYHVKELERIGLLKIVETKIKGNIIEKYYHKTAKDILTKPKRSKFSANEKDEIMSTILLNFIDYIRDEIVEFLNSKEYENKTIRLRRLSR